LDFHARTLYILGGGMGTCLLPATSCMPPHTCHSAYLSSLPIPEHLMPPYLYTHFFCARFGQLRRACANLSYSCRVLWFALVLCGNAAYRAAATWFNTAHRRLLRRTLLHDMLAVCAGWTLARTSLHHLVNTTLYFSLLRIAVLPHTLPHNATLPVLREHGTTPFLLLRHGPPGRQRTASLLHHAPRKHACLTRHAPHLLLLPSLSRRARPSNH